MARKTQKSDNIFGPPSHFYECQLLTNAAMIQEFRQTKLDLEAEFPGMLITVHEVSKKVVHIIFLWELAP